MNLCVIIFEISWGFCDKNSIFLKLIVDLLGLFWDFVMRKLIEKHL